MKRLIRWSIAHHWIVIALSAVLLAAGAWTARQMPNLRFIDAYETEVIDSPPQLAVNVGELTRLRHAERMPAQVQQPQRPPQHRQ